MTGPVGIYSEETEGVGGLTAEKTEAASVWALKFFGAELHNISSLEEEQRPEGSPLAPGVVGLLSDGGSRHLDSSGIKF